MPRNKLVERFYESIKNKYPELSFEEVNEACLFPYEYFRQRMTTGEMPDIRIKYFGSFQIFSTPVLKEIKKIEAINEKVLSKGEQIYPYYEERLKNMKDYVKNNPKVFSKNDKKRDTPN